MKVAIALKPYNSSDLFGLRIFEVSKEDLKILKIVIPMIFNNLHGIDSTEDIYLKQVFDYYDIEYAKYSDIYPHDSIIYIHQGQVANAEDINDTNNTYITLEIVQERINFLTSKNKKTVS